MIAENADQLPPLSVLLCLDRPAHLGPGFDDWIAGLLPGRDDLTVADPVDDIAMIAGTGATTDGLRGVQLTGTNVESMAAITPIGYPFRGRAGLSRPGTAHPRRRCDLLPDHDPGRRGGDHEPRRSGGVWRLIDRRRVTPAMRPPTLF